jgi:hypothetical protein
MRSRRVKRRFWWIVLLLGLLLLALAGPDRQRPLDIRPSQVDDRGSREEWSCFGFS